MINTNDSVKRKDGLFNAKLSSLRRSVRKNFGASSDERTTSV